MDYYKARISEFLTTDTQLIQNQLAFYGGNDPNQMKAWTEEISMLKEVFRSFKNEPAEIILEYEIPRLSKRADVVILIRGIIFVLEFKAGQTAYLQDDVEQVVDYALDLKNFHKESHNRVIAPVLVSTKADHYVLSAEISPDKVYSPFLVNNAESLRTIMRSIILIQGTNPETEASLDSWYVSRYEPTPTIIEAARVLYTKHSVKNITRTEASGENLARTTAYILDVIQQTKERNEKAICFVTGVPGAGKTLVGLNVAIGQPDNDDLAVYLSGNGPLVKVLTASLARDKQKREGGSMANAEREVRRFVQEIYNYREQMLSKIKTPIIDGVLEIDENVSVSDELAGHGEIEHIAIFDEAQRSWNHQKLADWLARGGSYGNKRRVPDFPMSEAEFLIWSMNLRRDWAVIVCLVGGGQEIHTGEAGIAEWLRAVNESFPSWKVYVSSHLKDKEYAEGRVAELLANNRNVTDNSDLHLSVSMRSFRAETLSAWVQALLDRDTEKAQSLYRNLSDRYPIVLTRDIETAKHWLKMQARGSERYGIIASSKASRLRPMAVDVSRKADVVEWFLGDKKNLQSSYFLEDVATEFDVQGLELDWTCVVWDGDLRYLPNDWDYYTFTRNSWYVNRQKVNREYQLNAYRVLLTRARQGMVICVPKGNANVTRNGFPEDATRLPQFYNGTYEYLKSIGIKEI